MVHQPIDWTQSIGDSIFNSAPVTPGLVVVVVYLVNWIPVEMSMKLGYNDSSQHGLPQTNKTDQARTTRYYCPAMFKNFPTRNLDSDFVCLHKKFYQGSENSSKRKNFEQTK